MPERPNTMPGWKPMNFGARLQLGGVTACIIRRGGMWTYTIGGNPVAFATEDMDEAKDTCEAHLLPMLRLAVEWLESRETEAEAP